MNDAQRKLIDELFTRALELPENERAGYVCNQTDDGEVRAEVMALLEAATSDGLAIRFEPVRHRLLNAIVNDDGEQRLTGHRVGHWRIGDRIARGGLATVYVAHRDDGAYDQRVAFKVLRRGLDTDDLIARFRTERQILSTLDHPGIARILDGGALPDGRPFLVLEFVDGTPITAYCDAESMNVRGRVRIVVDMLDALHHAHRHLVVHRDIKPSNVLISAEGHIALLDFGIAKLLDPEALPGTSTLTRTGVSLLTPGYGSPEQHAGEPVTTASDIYQVGMILYELLTGQRPTLAAADELQVPPSRHLRGTRRYGQVCGDLDAIVLKAMHVEPGRRYDSASEMQADLERYLGGRPVVARPDTWTYRLAKLTKRRPWLLPVASVVVLGIAAYVVTLTVYSNRLRLERQRAEAAQAFMVDLLKSPDPFAPANPERGRNITVLEALAIGRTRLETELAGQPDLRATLLGSVAGVYSSLDLADEAIPIAEEALSLSIEQYGEAAEASLEMMRLLGELYSSVGDDDRARQLVDRQLALARATLPPDDPGVGIAEVAAGTLAQEQGDLDHGQFLLYGGIDKLRGAPEQHAATLIAAIIKTTEQFGMGDAERYTAPLLEALDIAKSVYGPESLNAANVMLAIARNAFYREDYELAKSNYTVGLGIYDTRLGPDHVDTISHMNNYGVLLSGIGDYAAAESVHRELIDRLVAARGEEQRLVADNYQNLATAIHRQGRYEEALPLHRKAYELYGRILDEDHFLGVFPLLSIAYIELQLEDAAAAETAAGEALQKFRATVPGSMLEGVATCLVGVARERQGDASGSELVEASHDLIVPQSIAGSPYAKLCRVPGT